MHVLISGGTGFIGEQLVKSLLSDGQRVSVLTRDIQKGALQLGADVELVTSLDDISNHANIETIVNLAGAPIAQKRWSESRKSELLNSRLSVTQELVKLVARLDKKPQSFISGSAVGYYGSQQDQVVTEETKPQDEFSHQLCRAWEKEAAKVSQYQVRLCILRTGLVIGAGGGFLQQMLLPFKLGVGGRLGTGEQWMPWIHMADMLGLIRWFIEDQGCEGIYNGTAPAPVTNREFTRVLAQVLKRPALLPAPAFALELLMGEMSQLLLTGQRALPQRALDNGYQFHYPTLLPALQEALG